MDAQDLELLRGYVRDCLMVLDRQWIRDRSILEQAVIDMLKRALEILMKEKGDT